MQKLSIVLLALSWVWASGPVWAKHPGQDAFIQQAVEKHQLDPAEVTELLSQAKYQQSIIDAMTRPAEGKPWHQYRPIFLTPERIRLGVEFWDQHQEIIAGASEKYQVDEAIIVAIIGVETKYGRITGSYRVLDALATLGFYYPKRAAFFANELLEFMLLVKEENLPIDKVTGSYAGAMGLGQFIPSSYRAYAVDFDKDRSRDLWGSTQDAIASVANYLHRHRWHMGDAIVAQVARSDSAESVKKHGSEPESTVADLAGLGYLVSSKHSATTPASLLTLEQKGYQDHWLTFHNFYVITRYNRSPLYAMAVYQLSQAIKAARESR